MNYTDKSFLRFLDEQSQLVKMADEHKKYRAMSAAIEAADPYRGLPMHLEELLRIRRPTVGEPARAHHAATSLGSIEAETRGFEDLMASRRQLEELERNDHLVRLESQYQSILGAEGLSSATFQAIRKPIEDALRISRALTAENLIGLSSQDLIRQISPLHEHLRAFEQLWDQEEGQEQVDVDEKAPAVRGRIVSGIVILGIVLSGINDIVQLWQALNPRSVMTDADFDRIENLKVYVYDRQVGVGKAVSHLIATDRLHPSVTTTRVRLRSGPSMESDELEMLEAGASFLVTGQKPGWASGVAVLAEGRTRPGWIKDDYLVAIPHVAD